jgi:hypothetical protein
MDSTKANFSNENGTHKFGVQLLNLADLPSTPANGDPQCVQVLTCVVYTDCVTAFRRLGERLIIINTLCLCGLFSFARPSVGTHFSPLALI